MEPKSIIETSEDWTDLNLLQAQVEHATQAFFDPFFKLVNASRNDEDRDAVIGYDRVGRLLFVVHIEIEGEYIRIISARKATTSEHNVYDI